MDRKILYLFYSFNPTSVTILQSLPRSAFHPHPAVHHYPFQPFHFTPSSPHRAMDRTITSPLPAIPLKPSLSHYAMDHRLWTIGHSILHLPRQRTRAQNSGITFFQLREYQLHFILENRQQVQLHVFPHRFHDQVTGFG
ncbi:hypothetical protein SAMN04488505_11399 [Chitinophaga rupis]|uniref:Uncharacterized protein n=1 Tax=Chitinophaga rupis TaxID=573321 RepID=A0A1H8JQ38_9BACT|nr:hypothetical protein SAMN04488505_11399 [Chitinophaga rupis]